MARGVLIIGEPGVGKTTSTSYLNPEETFIVNVAGKGLPFRGWKKLYTPFNSKELTGNFISTANIEHIERALEIVSAKMPHIKNVIIDDANYISSFEFMDRAHEKGFEKFNSIAKNIFITYTKYRSLRDDIVVFYMAHPESTENIEGVDKIKTKSIGKLVDEKIVIEGLFTVVLYARAKKISDKVEYFFETQTDGKTPSKSPIGMFETFKIENNLQLVRDAMINYDE